MHVFGHHYNYILITIASCSSHNLVIQKHILVRTTNYCISSTMAFSSYALRSAIPTTFMKPSAIATPTAFHTPPLPTNAFSPFTSSNPSLTRNLKMNTALPQSCFSSLHKKSFTCRSQVDQNSDIGNCHASFIF